MKLDINKNSVGIPREFFVSGFSSNIPGSTIYCGKELVTLLQFDDERDVWFFEDERIFMIYPGEPNASSIVLFDIRPQKYGSDELFDYFIGWRSQDCSDIEGSLDILAVHKETGNALEAVLITREAHDKMTETFFSRNTLRAKFFTNNRFILIPEITESAISEVFQSGFFSDYFLRFNLKAGSEYYYHGLYSGRNN